MAPDDWRMIGCEGQKSEFNCTQAIGQEAADANFPKHWDTWITQDDINQIASVGLNTIRIPLGFWILEDLVDRTTEFFPRGGFTYLQRVCGWARDAGIFVVLDLHGAPGAQGSNNALTGMVSVGED